MEDMEVQEQIGRETLDERSRYSVGLVCAGFLFVLTLWVVTHAYLSTVQ
jgi:hypothetical protein